jgi:hypothetical protein
MPGLPADLLREDLNVPPDSALMLGDAKTFYSWFAEHWPEQHLGADAPAPLPSPAVQVMPSLSLLADLPEHGAFRHNIMWHAVYKPILSRALMEAGVYTVQPGDRHEPVMEEAVLSAFVRLNLPLPLPRSDKKTEHQEKGHTTSQQEQGGAAAVPTERGGAAFPTIPGWGPPAQRVQCFFLPYACAYWLQRMEVVLDGMPPWVKSRAMGEQWGRNLHYFFDQDMLLEPEDRAPLPAGGVQGLPNFWNCQAPTLLDNLLETMKFPSGQAYNALCTTWRGFGEAGVTEEMLDTVLEEWIQSLPAQQDDDHQDEGPAPAADLRRRALHYLAWSHQRLSSFAPLTAVDDPTELLEWLYEQDSHAQDHCNAFLQLGGPSRPLAYLLLKPYITRRRCPTTGRILWQPSVTLSCPWCCMRRTRRNWCPPSQESSMRTCVRCRMNSRPCLLSTRLDLCRRSEGGEVLGLRAEGTSGELKWSCRRWHTCCWVRAHVHWQCGRGVWWERGFVGEGFGRSYYHFQVGSVATGCAEQSIKLGTYTVSRGESGEGRGV